MTAPHPKRPGGRPYVPSDQDRKTVRAMAAAGIDQAVVASVLSITPPTLRKHFRRELDVSAAEANAKIAMKLYAKASDGDVVSMIFWLKTRAGWRETTRIEGGGPGSAPVDLTFRWADPPAGASKLADSAE